MYRAGSQAETAENALWESGTNQPLQTQAEVILAVHNRYRAEVGVPPLRWSANLSSSAQQWADYLAQTGTFQHSGRGGENLAKGTAKAFSVTQYVELWGDEKKHFINGIFPNVSSTGEWHHVGHYTQIIWRNCTEVGGGLATGNGSDILVCHYSPAGNVMNQPVL
ncbi:SCP-like extracellular [Pseudanabaenaceae cyanobacterium LEGE 13415]|nr:SCP-like extracellular [Pseudanabaenaceae cyanobacterium LEGE 13415]